MKKVVQVGITKTMSFSTATASPSELIIPKWDNVELESDEDNRIVAKCLDLQGAVTDGKNECEALDNIREAIQGIEEARSK